MFLSPQHAAVDVEHRAQQLQLGDPVPVDAVDVVAVEVRDEGLHRAVEAREGMRPVVLADRGDLVVARTEIDELRAARRS